MNNITKYLFIFILFGISLFQDKESILDKKKLAESYVEAELYDDAQNIYQNIFDFKTELLGSYHIELIPNLYDLYNIHLLMNNTDEAEVFLKKAFDIQYLNFLLSQKKFIPTFIKFHEFYNYKKDTLQTNHLDSLIFVLLNMNID